MRSSGWALSPQGWCPVGRDPDRLSEDTGADAVRTQRREVSGGTSPPTALCIQPRAPNALPCKARESLVPPGPTVPPA